MLIDLGLRHLLRMASRSWTTGTGLRHSARGRGLRRSLPQALLSEIDGLRLRDRAVGIGLVSGGPGLILRLLLIEVHALLRRDRHHRLQIACELHVLAGRHLRIKDPNVSNVVISFVESVCRKMLP